MIQKLGKYSVVEKLGEGAMGAVYKAYDEILGRYVAIKTMAEDIKWDQELKLRFYREARSAASLQHPNIVIIHDLGEDGKITYIVMELLEGKDLKLIIKEKERIPLEKKLNVIIQVADGLNHAHLHGIIHRDIKPGNIHVTPAGNVKILDFGIARIPSSDLTRSGVRLGTPVYMSPEQIRGGQYDERSDIFSAGIVFYEYLTYTHPFRDKNIVKTMDNILFQTQFPFAEQLPEAPAALWPILNTCMAKEPDKRYTSMADVGRACRRLLDEMNSSAQRLLNQIEDAAPRVAEAAERPGAPAPLVQLASSVRDAIHGDERPSYTTLKALHGALEKESLLGGTPSRPQGSAPPRDGTSRTSVQRDATAPAQSVPAGIAPDAEAVARAAEMFRNGERLLGEDRPEEALDMLRQAIGILGPREEYVQMLAQARRRIEERKKTRVADLLKAAREALASAQFAAAVESANGVLELDPDRAEAIEVRRQAITGAEAEKARAARNEQAERDKAAGFKLLAERKFRESLRALQRARDVLGDDTAIRLGIEEAEEGIRSEELKSRVQVELTEALQLFQADALDKARARVDRVLEMSPRHPEALELAAKIDRTLQQKERTARLARLLRDAREALDRKSFEEAAVLASEALSLDPEPDSAVSRLLVEIAEQKESTRRIEEVRLLLKKTEDALDRQDFDEAELHAGEALKVIPDHPAAAELLKRTRQFRDDKRRKHELNEIITQAQQAFLQGNLVQSEAAARRALVLDPESTKARDMIRRIEAAHDKVRKEKVAALLVEADRSLAHGDTAAAASKAREALEADPQNAEAAAFLRRAIEMDEKRLRDEIDALLAGGRNALNAREFDKARGLAQQVLQREEGNKNAKALLKDIEKGSRAAQKEREKEQKEAAKEQRKQTSIKEQEDRTEPIHKKSAPLEKTVILPSLASRKKSKAPIWIGAALLVVVLGAAGGTYWHMHRPGPASNFTQLIADARAKLAQNQVDEAIEALQGILKSAPANAEAAALLGDAQKQKRQKDVSMLMLEAQSQRSQNQFEESRKTLQKILELDPGNEPALAILSQLDAQESASKSSAEQDIEVKKWLANASAFIGAGKLAEARAELDKVVQLRPDAPELAALRRQIASARLAETAKKQKEQQAAVAQKVDRSAEYARKGEELFKQGKYPEAQTVVEQWLAEDGSSGPAQMLKNQISDAAGALKTYESANNANNFDEALAALAHLEKVNPADPSVAELRKRLETRKASARATFSVFRLNDAGTLLLDDQPIGTNGEVENKTIPVGKHKITIRTQRGRQSTYIRDFVDGENISLVYDTDLRLMTPGDKEAMHQRAAKETVYRYTVEHSHGFLKGKCNGELRISGVNVEYQGSDKEHSFSIPFRSLKLSVNNDKVELTDVHNTKYTFKVETARAGNELKDRWEKLQKLK